MCKKSKHEPAKQEQPTRSSVLFILMNKHVADMKARVLKRQGLFKKQAHETAGVLAPPWEDDRQDERD